MNLRPESLSDKIQGRLIEDQKAANDRRGRRRRPGPADALESGGDPETVTAVQEAAETLPDAVDTGHWSTDGLSRLYGLTDADPLFGLPEILASLDTRSSGTPKVSRRAAMDDAIVKCRDRNPFRLVDPMKRKACRDWWHQNMTGADIQPALLDVQRGTPQQSPVIGELAPHVDTWTRPKVPVRRDPLSGTFRSLTTGDTFRPGREWHDDDFWSFLPANVRRSTRCHVDPIPSLVPFVLSG
ncbi:hypothetical protein [Pseudonocardia adelaidensis]|uniref:hypothetical protein n=1 Tax=Pseudonocardia adelaidensis TaxID=648754 RepID=UPI0031E4F19E